MDRKKLPAIFMLSAAAITALVVYFRDLGLKVMLIALLAVSVAFYFIGDIVRMVLDSYYKENEAQVSDEGEVIEKGDESSEGEAESEDFDTEENNRGPGEGQ